MKDDYFLSRNGDIFNLFDEFEIGKMIKLKEALRELYRIPRIKSSIAEEHTERTPFRIVKSMMEMFRGCWEDPEEILRTRFPEAEYNEFIYVNDISFVSCCAHHNLPFFGRAHFGYLPDGQIVGLSKIPRLVAVYSKRPQVQEKLTREIVDTFDGALRPKGCGLVMEAYHLCMMIRGVEQKPAYTKTTALRGVFKSDISAKQEFLDGIKKASSQIWP